MWLSGRRNCCSRVLLYSQIISKKKDTWIFKGFVSTSLLGALLVQEDVIEYDCLDTRSKYLPSQRTVMIWWEKYEYMRQPWLCFHLIISAAVLGLGVVVSNASTNLRATITLLKQIPIFFSFRAHKPQYPQAKARGPANVPPKTRPDIYLSYLKNQFFMCNEFEDACHYETFWRQASMRSQYI